MRNDGAKKRPTPRRKPGSKRKGHRHNTDLERGIVEDGELQFLKAVDQLRRTKPFLDATDYYRLAVSLGIGDSAESSTVAAADVESLRGELATRLEDVRAAERQVDEAEGALSATRRELVRTQEELARVSRLGSKVSRELQKVVEDARGWARPRQKQVRKLRREIRTMKTRYALYGGAAPDLRSIEALQARLEASATVIAQTVSGCVTGAIQTLAKV